MDERATAAPPARRSWLRDLALLVLSVALALGCAEAVIRLFFKDAIYLFPRYHTDYSYGKYRIRGLRPNLVYQHTSADGTWRHRTNARGFSNARDIAYEKPAGTFRVLTLGDSHTQGNEVRQEQTYASVLERALSRNGKKAEVINAGVSGFGTAEELVLLENEGIRYRPDAVVLGFFANDFDDNLKSDLFGLDKQGAIIEKSFEYLPGVRIQNFIYSIPGIQWLGENSYFYSMLFNNVWIYAKLMLNRQTARKVSQEPGAEPTEIGAFQFTIPQIATRYQIDLALTLIQRMQDFCKRNGIRLIVVDVPAYLEKPHHFAPSMTAQVLGRLRDAGVEVISSQALLGQYNGVAELHVVHGLNHISEFTHTMIGAEVARRLTEGPAGPPAAR